MDQKQRLLQKCLLLIEEKLGWGTSRSWHNDMFIELSERIQQQTKVLLSPVTLKRVWGRIDYKSAPSITTLNTLAQFAGFQNWRDFKGKNSVKRPGRISRRVSANLGVIVLSASIMTIIFISFYSLRSPNTPAQPIDPSDLVFKSRPVTLGLPNSVVFDLDLGSITSDSIFIQQYWDPTKTIELMPGQKQATGQYYYPGYFRAKLLVDGEELKQHDLFIKTDGWLATLDYKPVPKYIEKEKISHNKLSFSSEILNEIASSGDPLRSTFHLVDDFKEISGDNFILWTTMRNTYREKWAVCQLAALMVLGTKGALVIRLGIPGCASELSVMMNDTYLNGKEHDLSGLSLDLSRPRDIEMRVRNKALKVLFEGKEHFSGSYANSIGRIVGLRYQFLGAGEVTRIRLDDILSNETIIQTDSSQNIIIIKDLVRP